MDARAHAGSRPPSSGPTREHEAGGGTATAADGVVVIGDEATCAGFRLAGVAVRSPTADGIGPVFEEAIARASLVVITRECAAALDAERLASALAGVEPLVIVVPGVARIGDDGGFARRIRTMLGIEA